MIISPIRHLRTSWAALLDELLWADTGYRQFDGTINNVYRPCCNLEICMTDWLIDCVFLRPSRNILGDSGDEHEMMMKWKMGWTQGK